MGPSGFQSLLMADDDKDPDFLEDPIYLIHNLVYTDAPPNLQSSHLPSFLTSVTFY